MSAFMKTCDLNETNDQELRQDIQTYGQAVRGLCKHCDKWHRFEPDQRIPKSVSDVEVGIPAAYGISLTRRKAYLYQYR